MIDREFWLYLDPGDSIYISAHIDDFGDTFSASGDKSVEAGYMIRKTALDFEALAQRDLLSPGSLVPDFTFTDIDGKSVKLSDLSGKLIYIDIWATWCGPCLAEHPHWDRLIEKYGDSDVAFLAISIDESPGPWEKMVREKEMKGYNWYAENAWQSEITTHFLISGIPRFILLDRGRRIIDPNADRPSGNINKLLDQHI